MDLYLCPRCVGVLGVIRPRIETVGGFGRFVLNRFGFWAAVAPWRTVYVLPEYRGEPWLIRHEAAHLAQMERDGWWTFWKQCVWWYFVPGYDRSPYEIEARQCEVDPGHPLIAGYDLAQ